MRLGRYELPAVPPGEYSLKFSLAGFKVLIRDGIRVTLGETATVDQVLDVAQVEERVVVYGRSPVVDRSGTALAHSLELRELAALPASRSVNAIIDATPGMHITRFEVGGGSAGPGGGWFGYGTSGLSQATLEGILIARPGPNGFSFDYGSFEHASVNLGAHGPEWPFPGVVAQLVTKSGGNKRSGSGLCGRRAPRLASVQHRRGSDCSGPAGPERSRGPGGQPAMGRPRCQRRRRRRDPAGSVVVVRLGPRPGDVRAAGQVPDHARADAHHQPRREGHRARDRKQPARPLRPGVAESSTHTGRRLRAADGGGQPGAGLDLEPARAGRRLEGRVECVRRAEALRRAARRAVPR